MNYINLNTAQPLYCPSTAPMVGDSAAYYFESDLSDPLILGRLRRNVVVNIPSIPALEQ